ncbi:ABC transporter substrate-binding protein [Neochlamydia sp. TUME1]|uniref:ABC transporter substrate-binding protein n=1 Tax=Neochlamydia sp. TUME1 TaxID=1478174 RepID=UPI00138DF782|nr:ABC transporter substrate-binding protein [Neochlamydia sp. TUME1]
MLIWWSLAFKQPNDQASDPCPLCPSAQPLPSIFKYLSTLQRETLHQALNGDYSMMSKLITDWDHDAQIMEQYGYRTAKRLLRDDFLRCQLLARQINNSSKEELDLLHDYYRLSSIQDDNGNIFDLSTSYKRFLPQTFVAASFLLALSEPELIVALPTGMRKQTSIYPVQATHLIALDADRYNTEKLYNARPDIAFVADYSNPSTLEALNKQGIPLFTLKHVNSPEEVQNALLRIGHIINRPIEAELLNYFVEAAMLAIDNRFNMISSTFPSTQQPPKVLFLKHHLTFSTPSSHTLTGKLLNRMGVKQLLGTAGNPSKHAWTLPIHHEHIRQMDPDYIIIATSDKDDNKRRFLKKQIFQLLKEKPNKPIAFVNEALQENPSQYMVLAYYDLYTALTRVN